MKKIITAWIILTVCGCQTAHKAPAAFQSSKEIISIQADKNLDEYGVEVRLAEYRLDKNGQVIAESRNMLSAPRTAGKPNQWLRCNVGLKPNNLDSNITYLLDGEMIQVPVFAGVNLVAKITPLKGNEVRVKGIFVSSMWNETQELISISMPIDVVCILGEEKVLYEKELKYEPIK